MFNRATMSRYLNGGAVTKCARCQETFDGQCYRSNATGKYYCSSQCLKWAETVEDQARTVN